MLREIGARHERRDLPVAFNLGSPLDGFLRLDVMAVVVHCLERQGDLRNPVHLRLRGSAKWIARSRFHPHRQSHFGFQGSRPKRAPLFEPLRHVVFVEHANDMAELRPSQADQFLFPLSAHLDGFERRVDAGESFGFPCLESQELPAPIVERVVGLAAPIGPKPFVPHAPDETSKSVFVSLRVARERFYVFPYFGGRHSSNCP